MNDKLNAIIKDANHEFRMALHNIHEKDYSSAKTWALKSKSMNPEQKGIDQLLNILNVLVYAPKSMNPEHGECDWYGVLGVDPSESSQVISTAYKKKALMVHPDKNHMPGAVDALDLLNEARNVLINKDMRAEYDRIRTGKNEPLQDFFFTDLTNSELFWSATDYFEMFNISATANPTVPPMDNYPMPAPKPQTQQGSESGSNSKQKAQKSDSGSNPKPQARKGTKRSNIKKVRPAKQDTVSSSEFKVPKPTLPGFYSCVVGLPAMANTISRKRTRKDIKGTLSGQRVPEKNSACAESELQNTPDSESNAAKKAKEKGKSVVIDESLVNNRTYNLWI